MKQPKSRSSCLLMCLLLYSGIQSFTAASERKSMLHFTGKNIPAQPSTFKTTDTTASNERKEDGGTTLIRKSRESPSLSVQEESLRADQQEMNSDAGMKKYVSQIKKSTIIPSLRVGRSEAFDENAIFPYPDEWIIPHLVKNPDKVNSADESIFQDESNDDDYSNDSNNDLAALDESQDVDAAENTPLRNFLDLPDIMSDDLIPKSVNERQIQENSTLIPYPRYGKRSIGTTEKITENTAVRNKRTSESLIPQFRYGRSVLENKIPKIQKQPFYILPNYRPGRSMSTSVINKLSSQGILPYPRPGRSNSPESITNYILPIPRYGRTINNKMESLKTFDIDSDKDLEEELVKDEESKYFFIPYPRPGKRFFGTKPLPPNVNFESKGKEFSIHDTNDKDPNVTVFFLPYPRPGRSNTQKKDSIVPNVRFGRTVTNSMVPYPRFGRSSNNVLPHFRFGKSYGSILPNPRFGRSKSKYRIGGEMVSRSIIPQMRVGKSADFEFSHQNDDVSKVQKVNTDFESDNSNESEELPKSSSERVKPTLLVPTKKLHKHMLMHDSDFMLPYPRPGRFV